MISKLTLEQKIDVLADVIRLYQMALERIRDNISDISSSIATEVLETADLIVQKL